MANIRGVDLRGGGGGSQWVDGSQGDTSRLEKMSQSLDVCSYIIRPDRKDRVMGTPRHAYASR